MRTTLIGALAATFLVSCEAPQDTLRIAGSSTVFPFARTVAEHYSVKFEKRAPVIEMTGTGGGLKAFCTKDSVITIANASREIKESERELCARNGVADILEFKIGFDGIVVAASRDNPLTALTLDQIYRALAKDLPTQTGFAPNPNEKWSDVDPSLPDRPIEIHGPPPTSGTRDAFVELALDAGARENPRLAALAQNDPQAFAARAGAIREDGKWIDEGENDNAIIQIIRQSPYALGVFGYSFYDQNRAVINGVTIDASSPDFDSIARGDYPLARSLYFYLNEAKANENTVNYVLEFTSESALGPYGYLADKGLIPLPEDARKKVRALAAALSAHSSHAPDR